MTDPISSGTCGNWVNAELDDCHPVPEGMTPAQQQQFTQAASEYLWAMTGRRLGPSCPVIVRPCRKSCADEFLSRILPHGYSYGGTTGSWIPYVYQGEIRNASLCGCTADCHCGPELCEIELPGPIYDVTEVNINGTVVNPATYRVTDGRFLVRSHGAGPVADADRCWPMCQDMSAKYGSPDTFTVTYRTGLALPELGKVAALELASHLMADCGGCGCGLSGRDRQNLSRLTRQGVELEFADAQQVFQDGRTGLPGVDRFIQAYNPYGLKSPMRVLSPDYRRPRMEQP